MAADPSALLSVAEAKAWLEIATLTTTYDSLLEDIIDSVSMHFESVTNRSLKRRSASPFTHYFYGNGRNELLLKEFPADKPSHVYIDSTWTFGGGTELSTSAYEVLDGVLLVSTGTFTQGIRNVKVVYESGYATVPDDLKLAALHAVEYVYQWRNSRRLGIQSSSKVGETTSFFEGMPKTVQDLLAPYYRDQFVKDTLGPAYGNVPGGVAPEGR